MVAISAVVMKISAIFGTCENDARKLSCARGKILTLLLHLMKALRFH